MYFPVAGHMTGLQLVEEAERRGLTLNRVGTDLHVIPGRLCPADFADMLRVHKPELLALLADTSAGKWPQVVKLYRPLTEHERTLLVRFCGNEN
jgi:hypothetical protein